MRRLPRIAALVSAALSLGLATDALAAEALDAATARRRAEAARTIAATLSQLAARPTPAELTRAQRKSYGEQSAWLTTLSGSFGSTLGGGFGEAATLTGDALVAKMVALNKRWLVLQEAAERESARFATLSEASTARHEAAMNAIRNMK